MEINKLISLKPHRNYKATVYSIAVLALYIFAYALMVKRTFKNNSIPTFDDFDIFEILVITLWFLIIISIVWSYRIAKQTGREPATWIVIGFFAGPIGLLILSLKDYKIKNDELLHAIKMTRQEYVKELRSNRNKDSDFVTGLEQKYHQLLTERSAEIITKEKVETLKELVENGVIDPDTDLKEKERIIKFVELNKIKDSEIEKWNPEWIDDTSICPACGAKLDKESNNCLNCGLRIK